MDGLGATERRTGRRSPARLDTHAILAAAASLTAEVGWDSLSMAGLAKRLGISSTPLYERFPDLTSLGVALWQQILSQRMLSILGPRLLDATRGDDDALRAIVTESAFPDATVLAAVDLILASQYDERLDVTIREDLAGAVHQSWAGQHGLTRISGAQCSYLALACLGLIMVWPRATEAPLDLDQQVAALSHALAHPTEPTALPHPRPPSDAIVVPPTGEEPLDRLFVAVLEEVATVGYRRATIQRITQSAAVSRGFITGRFRDKSELFAAASAQRHANAYATNAQFFLDLAQSHGFGVAEAVTIRHLLSIDARSRRLATEQQRRVWVDHRTHIELAKADREHLGGDWREMTPAAHLDSPGQQHWDLALGLGVAVLPLIVPHAATLPYDAVTIPLLG